MEIIFDQAKRDRTFADRGLAFEDAAFVFAGPHFTIADDRRDYGEPRYLTVSWAAVSSLSSGRRGVRRVA